MWSSVDDSHLCRQSFTGVGNWSGIFSDIRKWKWRSKKPGAQFTVSTSSRLPRTSCNICNPDRLVSIIVPSRTKSIWDRAGRTDVETPMASIMSRIWSKLYFVQSLNKPPEKSCQAAAMIGLELKFSGCLSAGVRSDKLAETIHRAGFTESEIKIMSDTHKALQKTQ